MKLLTIDGNSVLNRAFYGIKLLTTKEGVYTNGIYGFLSILLKILDETSPDRVAVAFDQKGPTFRHEQFEAYKAGRKGMPPELASQLPILKQLLADLGYAVVECAGYEADDILGTLSRACEQQGGQCVIATGDRDALQLVTQNVQVRLATTKMGRPESTLYDIPAILEKYTVTPEQLIDVKALMGDSSDNIPGVAGIGEKTAIALIHTFHDLDQLYANLADPSIRPAVRQKLEKGREIAYLSRDLARIRLDAPVDRSMDAYVIRPAEEAKAAALLSKLEMFSMISRFGLKLDEVRTPSPAQKKTRSLKQCDAASLLAENIPLFLCWDDTFTHFALSDGDNVGCFAAEQDGLLESVLTSPVPKSVADVKALYRKALEWGVEPAGLLFDATLAGYLLNPTASGYDLERLSAEYAQQDFSLPQQEGYEVPLERLARLMAVYPPMQKELAENQQEYLLQEVEIPLAQVLAQMERDGFGIDREELIRFGEEMARRIEQLEQEIYQLAGESFNIASPKQLGVILFEKLGLPAGKKTKTGYSTNADVLDYLKDKHPIIPLILDYRTVTKLKSTYVDGFMKLIGADGRIHSSFNQTETRTGRISSTEPNMQNIPVRTPLGSNLRKFFKARAGYVLVDADYSQIELRVLAHVADDKTMQQAFLDGTDIHTVTASQVFDQPPMFVTPLMRSRAKAVNFGIVYGIGAFSLSQDIGVSVAQADQYIKDYLKTYSGVKTYMEEIVAFGKEHGYVETMFHRRRYLPELAASNKNLQAFGKRVAMNTPIQGTAADIIKIAMVKAARRLQKEKLDARIILQVHDELIIEASEQDAQAAQLVLQQEMEHAVSLKVPLSVDCGIGSNWYDAK